jgi:oligoribonuclease NrnB/cAMP/cGMP phosphodiesterase (DHH superfamily)
MTYVLYHGNCWDGFCAAWIANGVHTALRTGHSHVEFIPVQYGQDPPRLEPKSFVYILDFSYPRDQLLRWLIPGPQAVTSLTILDHHKTAEEALAGLASECVDRGYVIPTIVFDMKKSGGRLTWEHFHPDDQRVPALVDYTEDRDLWRFVLADSRAVNACLRSYPLDFETWNRWGQLSAAELRALFAGPGEAILRRERQIIDDHLRHAREIELDGHKIMAVNATVLFSDIAGELAADRPFGACYFDRQDGKRVWSLRSRDGGVDVSEIAKRHGGGGHRDAAGFEEVVTMVHGPGCSAIKIQP